jgi:hypothetical protein
MGHREAAELEVGEERLHVAQRRLAGGGVAVVADAARPAGRHHLGIAEDVAHQAEALVGMEQPLAVEGDDARGLLAAMLQGMEAERDERARVLAVPDADDAALLVELVVIR